MKHQKLNFMVLALTLLVSACQISFKEENKEAAEIKKDQPVSNKLLLFVDKSLSLDRDTLVQQKLQTAIAGSINAMQTSRDEVVISYLYENTGAMSNAFVYPYNVGEIQELEGLSSNEKMSKEAQRQMFEKIYREGFIEEIILEAFAFDPTGKETHIIDALDIIKRYAKKENTKVTVLFLSDMIESSPFRNMRFTGTGAIASKERARKLAGQDIARLKEEEYGFMSGDFSNVESIEMCLPAVEMAKSPYLKYVASYWQEIFAAFGVEPIHIAIY